MVPTFCISGAQHITIVQGSETSIYFSKHLFKSPKVAWWALNFPASIWASASCCKTLFWISIKSVRSSQNKCSYQEQLLLISFICPSRIFVCFLQFLRGQDSNWTNIGVNVFLYILGCNATTLVGNEFQRWNYVPLIYRVGLCRLWTSF